MFGDGLVALEVEMVVVLDGLLLVMADDLELIALEVMEVIILEELLLVDADGLLVPEVVEVLILQ